MSKSNIRIYLSSPHMGGEEKKYINEAFNDNWIAPLGPNVDNFEIELAKYLGVNHVACLSSGTAAIHLSLIMLGVKPGDYIIAQSFTFSATINPIVYCGATPILIDSEQESWNMDPDLLERAIIDCLEGRIASGVRDYLGETQKTETINFLPPRKPKAIIPVHLYGMPANMTKIMAISEKYGIPVIEDAAESLGSRFIDKMTGSFGKMGILSFNGNKIITTSGGGALVSDDEVLIKQARFLATQSRDAAPHYQHSQIGYNYRMSNIIAGIGRGQLEVVNERVKQRRDNFLFYKRNLSRIKGVSFIEETGPEFYSNRWLTTILIDPSLTGTDRENVRQELEKENIETRPLWKPMHLQPVFQTCPAFVTGVSEGLFNKGLCLPSGSNMTDGHRERVLNCLLEALKS